MSKKNFSIFDFKPINTIDCVNPKIIIDESSNAVFGIGGSSHDYSACIIKDGKILTAIESERISRRKHAMDVFSPIDSAINYLVPNSPTKVSSIATSDILNTFNWLGYTRKVKYYNHHLCHASSTFFTSPFKESAIFVCDGLGSFIHEKEGYVYETYSYYKAEGIDIKLLGKNIGWVGEELAETDSHHVNVPNSLGLFYIFITKMLGFEFLQDGKTMGLSAYGIPKYYAELKEYFTFKEKGIVLISFGEKESLEFYKKHSENINEKEVFQFRADIAASAQKIFEETYFYCLNYLYKITKCENLCLSGGVTLNSVANGKITKMTPFKNVYIFPQCGDAGIAVGAAYLSYYEKYAKRILIKKQTPFLGKQYTEKEIKDILNKYRIKFKKDDDIYAATARLIEEGKIVGWFQGRSEIGPRALGHRSIVVDPRKDWMKDYLNEKVKKREFFRPFAPAILEECTKEYFEPSYRSPYMTEVFNIKQEKQRDIPAVVHFDGTGRLQTVGKDNIEFYKLINSFHKLTGVPVLLNTSFNVNKMPIVETPEDAVRCFLETNIDVLILKDYICQK